MVRIDNLDPPREVAGSASGILRTLDAFGFEWDGPVVYQSQRTDAYREAATELRRQSLAYDCTCSRTEIAAAPTNIDDNDDPRYPGWCRAGSLTPSRSSAIRFLVPETPVTFTDGLQGTVRCHVGLESGDFIIQRRDGWYAYQLACAVDDAAQGITEVVRGIDLMSSTCRQILLQHALALPTPGYQHLPLAVDKSGAKLSKSAASAALDESHPALAIWHALAFLQQRPPPQLRPQPQAGGPATELWAWAIEHWSPEALRGRKQARFELS